MNPAGVKLVMDNFFHDLGLTGTMKNVPTTAPNAQLSPEEDLACEEALLAAFEPDAREG